MMTPKFFLAPQTENFHCLQIHDIFSTTPLIWTYSLISKGYSTHQLFLQCSLCVCPQGNHPRWRDMNLLLYPFPS